MTGRESLRSAYTPWSQRVAAALVDLIPVLAVSLAPFLAFDVIGGAVCRGLPNPADVAWCERETVLYEVMANGVVVVVIVAFVFWNHCHRQGRTGQSIGKQVMHFQVVSESTWRPIGFGASIGRLLAHYVDQLVCFVGFLLPLWEGKRRTLADMIVGTVCVPSAGRQGADGDRS
jgi:uncharacterized RDD family membrane protein YckC